MLTALKTVNSNQKISQNPILRYSHSGLSLGLTCKLKKLQMEHVHTRLAEEFNINQFISEKQLHSLPV